MSQGWSRFTPRLLWPPDASVIQNCSAFNETDDEEQNNSTDRRTDNPADVACAQRNAETRKQEAGDECADNADDDVTDETEAEATDDLPGEPAGDRAHD